MIWLQLTILLAVLGLLVVATTNLFCLKRLGDYPKPQVWPRVSVLVPARNEEHNIGPCLESLLSQDYPDYQVICLDDCSEDRTWQVMQKFAKRHRFVPVQGKEPPEGWLGKHWACHQLAQMADGEIILFTDADTVHKPETLRAAVAAMLSERADLLTAIPKERAMSWGEKMVVPVISWGVFSFVPVCLAHKLSWPSLSLTIGQFMMFKKEVYEKIGGHAAVRSHATDDMALGRLIKAKKFTWRILDASNFVTCRMYSDFKAVFQGFSRHIFAAFDYRVLPFVLALLVLALILFEPFALLILAVFGVIKDPGLILASGACTIGMGLSWLISNTRLGLPAYIPLLYPAITTLLLIIAVRSSLSLSLGKLSWKGRNLLRHRVKFW